MNELFLLCNQQWTERPNGIEDHRTLFDADKTPQIVPVNLGPCPRFERKVLQEDDVYEVFIDSWGIKRRNYKDGSSMAQFLEYPVKTRRDWEKFKEERLDPEHPERLNGPWRELCTRWMAEGYPIQLGWYPDLSLFGGVRWLLGVEEGLIAFYTMPDLIHEIMDHLTSLYLTVFEKVVEEVRVDVIHFWEDMCGKQGPLISPEFWDRFMGPNYRRISEFAEAHCIPVLSVDTDGDPDRIIPSMMRAGVNLLLPLEVAAGCDINVMQQKYPTLGMMGGIDKRALAESPEAIDRELERIKPAVGLGRYIPDLDHMIPHDISWDNYCCYAERLKALVGKA
jgi:uroporphyrinogen decarboxylase